MIAFAHRRAFWFGIAAVSAGVVLHLPMYVGARDMGYQLAGMPMDPWMKAGMALIVVGIALSGYGLVPRGVGADPDRVAGVRVAALDEAPIRRAHLALLAVMAVAVTIDVMNLFRRPLGGLTTAVVLFGLGWGLVNSGFLLWLPTNLRQLGLETGAPERLLAGAAIIGFPAVFVVALLYGWWSSRWTMIGVALLTSVTLLVFALLGRRVGDHPSVLQALIVLLLVGTNAILAVLTPYSSEVYPTRVRARGTGLAGACARVGGLLGVSVVVIGLAPPSLTGAAVLGAVPTALAALTVARYGVETRRRRLEEITAIEVAAHTSGNTARPMTGRRTMDYLVIGAGPAGLQLGYFLERAGRDYLILEAGRAPGTFFSRFPRHRRLISINKPHTGWDGPELNLRMDWNSLLSDDPRLLFTRYTGRYLALTIVGSTAVAEDVAQEAFLRIWRNATAYNARRGQVATWVLTITRNLAIDTLRLRGKHEQPIDPHALTGRLLSREERQSSGTHVEDKEHLRSALRALPPEQGRLIVLSVFYGLTAKETAEVEGIPLGTAKTRIRRGIAKLRQALGVSDG